MAILDTNAYGKTRVRLTYVDRTQEVHELRELSVDILLSGDFEPAYKDGDNARVLPTDTMKNTVYVLARQTSWDSIENFAQTLARHFLDNFTQVSAAIIRISQSPWFHIGPHKSAFLQAGNEQRTARVQVTRSVSELFSGLEGLQILKTADSAFSGFLKDSFTTLPETDDRLFGTVLTAEWDYLAGNLPFNDLHHQIRLALLDCFAAHRSLAVQHTLFAMGSAVLERFASVASIHLVMPNKHRLLFDLTRFGLDNPNQIFVPIEEPSGYIEARLVR